MKKILSVLAVILLVGGFLVGCGNKEANKPAEQGEGGEKLKIVTTIFPPYDFAKKIGGDKVEVVMLLNPGAESHSYQPSPKDIETIKSADLFIYTGSHNEYWADKILEAVDGKKPEVMKLMDLVPLLEEEVVEGMEDHHDHEHAHDADDKHNHENDHDTDHKHDHEHEHDADDKHNHDHDHDTDHKHDHEHDHDADDKHDHDVDEHVWTSPINAIKIVAAIRDKMIAKDTANKDYYEENAKLYTKELETLDKEIRDLVNNAKRRTILFGDRFPFRYFAAEYKLDYYAAFTGCSTETEADASTIVFLEKQVKEKNLPVVFTIEMSNGKIADAISEDTGAKKLVLHSCHNLTKDEAESGEDYLSIMRKNLKNLGEALN